MTQEIQNPRICPSYISSLNDQKPNVIPPFMHRSVGARRGKQISHCRSPETHGYMGADFISFLRRLAAHAASNVDTLRLNERDTSKAYARWLRWPPLHPLATPNLHDARPDRRRPASRRFRGIHAGHRRRSSSTTRSLYHHRANINLAQSSINLFFSGGSISVLVSRFN
jgi:hypothetical protein